MMDRPCRDVECKTRVNLDLLCHSLVQTAPVLWPVLSTLARCSAFQRSSLHLSTTYVISLDISNIVRKYFRRGGNEQQQFQLKRNNAKKRRNYTLGKTVNSGGGSVFQEFRNVTRFVPGSPRKSNIWTDGSSWIVENRTHVLVFHEGTGSLHEARCTPRQRKKRNIVRANVVPLWDVLFSASPTAD